MNYQQILPAEPLRKYVRSFWILADKNTGFSQKAFKIIPDGLPGLIFQENPVAFTGKDNQPLPQLFLYGQTTQHTIHTVTGNFLNIGVYFQPSALKDIFGINSWELTNRHSDMNALVKTGLTEQLLNTPQSDRRIELLSIFLMKQAAIQPVKNEKIAYAAVQLQQGDGLKSIRSKLNISESSLERQFKQCIGISPKLYARITRFQSTLENLRKAGYNRLTDIAYENDYFDQSHFIRDFKAFSGTSPKQYISRANEQVANFPEWKM